MVVLAHDLANIEGCNSKHQVLIKQLEYHNNLHDSTIYKCFISFFSVFNKPIHN